MKGEPLALLLVEDNDDHAELVLRSFGENQVRVGFYRAHDGEEALDFLYRRGKFSNPDSSPRPHVVFLDLKLPKVSGQDVLKTIKADKSLKTIPVVVLSSSAAEVDIVAAYTNHVNSYVIKPLDFTKFTDLMKDLNFYWLGWNVGTPEAKKQNE